jgi:hypothetical protein
MYNFFSRHYIFRRSDGEILDIYCNNRHDLCSARLGGKSILPEPTVIARDVHPYFYAEMDENNVYHVLYQDNTGNINYIYMDGQWSRVIPVLGSKTPSAYNKQLYIAPLKNNIYLFYVLQHDNSFLLAYQTVTKSRVGTPKIVDYVSGSSIPCSLIYDSNENIYAFYQSYDGKYLQLGYKKMDTARKHWSDFTPVTKFMGSCEYPHAIIDSNGTIHLCYQRRTQKQYELVYQQKGRDKNLWSAETILHSSVYPFENSSVIQTGEKIYVYWIRDDVIYYTASGISGSSWGRPARYGSQPGRQLQCICWKEQSASPGIFPGTLSNGVRLIFLDSPVSKTAPQLSQLEAFAREGGPYAGEMKGMVMDSIKQLQEKIDEINTGWTGTKKELARMTNAYADLSRELGKLSLRLNLLENKIREISNPYRSAVIVAGDKVGDSSVRGDTGRSPEDASYSPVPEHGSAPAEHVQDPENQKPAAEEAGKSSEKPAAEKTGKPSEKPGSSLDPEARKIWEEWQEPREWTEGS